MTEEIRISTMGMNCPKPLIETRKAMRRMAKGQVLVVEGDHAVSKDEIPQAMRDTGDEVVSVVEKGGRWTITIRKG
ncbi:MAG: sulfurtransferase TusA family protein [Thermoplasmata archaeon]|nr:sulfurtransferase TusA family protein [Thermoplasmata archaeon]